MEGSKKLYDPWKTKCCGWVFLVCTMFFDLMLILGAPVTLHLLPGDHSLFNLGGLGFASDSLSKTSAWYVLHGIAGYLSFASILLKIPVCVAAIWKNKELPLLLLIVAATFSSGVLECYAVARNGFPSWIQGDVAMMAFHIIGNAVLFVILLRQMLLKKRVKDEKNEKQ